MLLRLALGGLLVLWLPAATASAQPGGPGAGPPLPCAAYATLKRQLRAGYGEGPVSFGVQPNGNLLQVFASGAGASEHAGPTIVTRSRPADVTTSSGGANGRWRYCGVLIW